MYLPALNGKAISAITKWSKTGNSSGGFEREFNIGFEDFRTWQKVPAIPFEADNEAGHTKYQMEVTNLQGGKKESNQIF
jgi:hypothetical protein